MFEWATKGRVADNRSEVQEVENRRTNAASRPKIELFTNKQREIVKQHKIIEQCRFQFYFDGGQPLHEQKHSAYPRFP